MVQNTGMNDINETPPVCHSLEEIYHPDSVAREKKRYINLSREFKKRFNKYPNFMARAPGRINIIGEHIDYAGFSVLPMAIDKDIVIAVSTEDSTSPIVSLSNIDSNYSDYSFLQTTEENVLLDDVLGLWPMYFKCGYKGMRKMFPFQNPPSMLCLVDGTIPKGAGCSSSSALVCAASLATMEALDESITKVELAECAIKSERYIGMESGGMDQTCSILAQQGSALYVSFKPSMRAMPISLPSNIIFVVTNSMVVSDKQTTAPTHYNLRVCETRFGAVLLSKYLNLKECLTLRDVHDEYMKSIYGQRTVDTVETIPILRKLLESTDQCFKREPYSLYDVSKQLQQPLEEVREKYTSKFVVSSEDFKLYQRTRHVLSEALRVQLFRERCAFKKGNFSDEDIQFLGELMNQSQQSCKDDYECSCEELDDLIMVCRNAGSFGSRLTGAGWGGCCISLIKRTEAESFVVSVIENYYKSNEAILKQLNGDISKILLPSINGQIQISPPWNDIVFLCDPSLGACIIDEKFM